MTYQRPNGDQNKLDLTGQCLRKLAAIQCRDHYKINILILDDNEIQKLEYIDKFSHLHQLSASRNHILRMFHISKLFHLVKLDLSHNSIVVIEGLKGLTVLKYLNLSNNKIKQIEKIQANVCLEHLDLSDNSISALSNISDLRNLKKLFLHRNIITQLRHAELYLPKCLAVLTLAGNRISDLAEVSRLAALPCLSELSFISNPCVEQDMGKGLTFDYRIYLINWCLELKVIDGFVVDEIERLKAEWLYSQGKGRKFKPGQHDELVNYLMETCSVSNLSLMTENERKLRLILSKAHQHQKQLQLDEDTGTDPTSSSELMTRSLDSSLLECCSVQDSFITCKSSMTSLTRSLCESSLVSSASKESYKSCISQMSSDTRMPLPAATKLVPVPESLVSPLVANPPPIPSFGKIRPSSQFPVSTKYVPSEISAPTDIPTSPKSLTPTHFATASEIPVSSKINPPSKIRPSSRFPTSTKFMPSTYIRAPYDTQTSHRSSSSQAAASSQVPLSTKNSASIQTPSQVQASAATQIPSATQVQLSAATQIPSATQVQLSAATQIPSATQVQLSAATQVPSSTQLSVSSKSSSTSLSLTSVPDSDPSQCSLSPVVTCINLQHQGASNRLQDIKKEDSNTSVTTEGSATSSLGSFSNIYSDSETAYYSSQCVNVPSTDRMITIVHDSEDESTHDNEHPVQLKNSTSSLSCDEAALTIQRHWRGFHTRKLHPCVYAIHKYIVAKRTYDHIQKLNSDYEVLRSTLGNERRLQLLHLQATKALWKKVQEIQESLASESSGASPGTSISTQTDITAFQSPTQDHPESS